MNYLKATLSASVAIFGPQQLVLGINNYSSLLSYHY